MAVELDIVSVEFLQKLSDCYQRENLINWLSEKNYVFEIGKSGWPKVTTTYINKRLGGISDEAIGRPAKHKRGNAEELRRQMGAI
jgi:hypothetical protein